MGSTAALSPRIRITLPPLHPLQHELYEAMQRFNVWPCHRRFGKTFLSTEILLAKALSNPLRAPRYAYLAPYYKQAKAVAWDLCKGLTRQIPGTTFNESELRCVLPGNREIRLFGADNPDALRGLYLDGVVLDEYAQMRPRVWDEIIRPTLTDRQGWAIFIGTPMGRNHFYALYEMARQTPEWTARLLRASETDVIPATELAALKAAMSQDAYDRELECSWLAAVPGAYYAEEFRRIDAEGRIRDVPYDPRFPVYTAWDLGRNDVNAIWYLQMAGQEVRCIDYDEGNNVAMAPDPDFPAKPSWIATVREKPYIYDHHLMTPPLTTMPYEVHYGPHDLMVHEYSTNKTRYGIALAAGLRFTVLPHPGPGGLLDGIEDARRLLDRSVFDARRCHAGTEALRNYQREWDEDNKVFRDHPLHNWASNGASAYRYAAVGLRPAPIAPPPQAPPRSFAQMSKDLDRYLRTGRPMRPWLAKG